MSALHTVHLLPQANVPAQCMWWTNAFTTGGATRRWYDYLQNYIGHLPYVW